MAESWSLPNISFMAPQEAPRSALLQGAEADQGPGSTARRAADAPAIAIPSRGRERQLAPRCHAEPSHVSPRGSSTVHAMDPWILEPQTAGETRIFLESWPLSFLRAGPPKSRKKAGESRTHPSLETNFAKLRPGPNSDPHKTRRSGRGLAHYASIYAATGHDAAKAAYYGPNQRSPSGYPPTRI